MTELVETHILETNILEKGLKVGANLVDKTQKMFEVTDDIDSGQWLLGMHQALLFFLVIGRWLLPRGHDTIRYVYLNT